MKIVVSGLESKCSNTTSKNEGWGGAVRVAERGDGRASEPNWLLQLSRLGRLIHLTRPRQPSQPSWMHNPANCKLHRPPQNEKSRPTDLQGVLLVFVSGQKPPQNEKSRLTLTCKVFSNFVFFHFGNFRRPQRVDPH